MAINHSKFPLFSSLPRELRDRIWRDSLPAKLKQALYPYRKGCWCPRRLSKSDEGYDSEREENNLCFEFRHDMLDAIQLEIPPAFVNREAHGIACAWARKQDIKIRLRQNNKHHPVFVRAFEPKYDALYIALDKWDDFLREPHERQQQTDLSEQLVDIRAAITRIAVPEALFRTEIATLPETFWYFLNVGLLFVIVDAESDLQSMGSSLKTAQYWWQIERSKGKACFWNSDRGCFSFGEGEDTGHEAVHQLVEVSNGLANGLVTHRIRSLEIRPVVAVRI